MQVLKMAIWIAIGMLAGMLATSYFVATGHPVTLVGEYNVR